MNNNPHESLIRSLEDGYRAVDAERGGAQPFYNHRLQVEAVGFRHWENRPTGVLITPWFMNLILLPRSDDAWHDLDTGVRQSWSLPSAEYEFTVAPRLGEAPVHQALALFTTVVDMPDQATARAIAQEILVNLMKERPIANGNPRTLAHSGTPSLSRRALLGRLLPLNEEHSGHA